MLIHRRIHRPRGLGEDGFILVFLALVLVVLMAAAAVAIDIGSRYTEAAKIQRAADAAALAGVAVLPKGLPAARAEALQVAARNGYAEGVDGVTVSVVQLGAEEIQVRITDPDVPQYFASLFAGPSRVARTATARFVRAVSLGSPRNFLGTGDLLGSSSGGDMRQLVGRSVAQSAGLRENYWLAISGECSSKENGDRFNTLTDANYQNATNPRALSDSGAWASCEAGTTTVNPDYRSYGYLFAVSVPAGALGAVQIQAFDPAVCNRSRPGDPNNSSTDGMRTDFTVRTGSTDPLGGTLVGNPVQPRTFSPGTTGCNAWTTIANVTPPPGGATYFIQVDAGRNTNQGTMSNGFGLRASVTARNLSGRFWACSSDPVEASIYDASCPQVYALGDMGVFASLTGSKAEFFLAEVGPEYNGRKLEVTLFDPGEGAQSIRIKSPDGGYATFRWSVDCAGGATAPTGGCSGASSNVLDLVGMTASCSGPDVDTNGDGSADRCVFNPQPGSRRLSRWKYSDRSITLTIDLPADISSAYGGATWWKVEYTTNISPTDRTTWAAEVKGDPVRLVPNP